VGDPFLVAIDGPAGAGKSSVSLLLAQRLGFALVDTGAIYRCVGLAATRKGISFDDDAALGALLPTLYIAFSFQGSENRVRLGAEDVTQAIRAPEISRAASAVSARPVVRDGLLDLQRRLARSAPRGAVLEGRDIGTVVFPDAKAKFFLTATSQRRADRRYRELLAKGATVTLETVLQEQNQRDRDDSERAVAPLRAALDAVIVDSTDLPLEKVVASMESVVNQRMREAPPPR
jgi:cytidylate kinase